MSSRSTDNLHDSKSRDFPTAYRHTITKACVDVGFRHSARDMPIPCSGVEDDLEQRVRHPRSEPAADRRGVRPCRPSATWSATRSSSRPDTWVVKVGTSVLTGPDGTLDPARIDHLAEQISAVMDTGRKVALVSSGAVGAGIGQLGLKRRPDNLPPAPGRRRGRPGLPDPGLRRGPAPARPARRPAPADPRGLRQPAPLPQHAEHAHRAVRVERRPDHQRERHDQRRRDQVRRQRPPGRDGHEPAPGAAARHPERRRRSLPDRSRRPQGRERGRSRSSRRSTTRSSAWPARAAARWAPAACRASSPRPGW